MKFKLYLKHHTYTFESDDENSFKDLHKQLDSGRQFVIFERVIFDKKDFKRAIMI